MLEEGVSSLREIETGMMTGAGILPGPVRARRRARARRDAGRARARRGRVGRALRAADRSCAGSSRRGGSARRRGQGFFPYPQPDARLRPEGDRAARDARRRSAIIWLNRPPANPLSPQVITEFGELWKHCHESDEIRSVVIASIEHLHVLRRRRHQGVHEDGRLRRRGPARLRPRDAARDGDARARRRSRPSTASRSAAAASSRWRATSASRPSRRRSASRRSTSASFPASAARSGCRDSWARARRSR